MKKIVITFCLFSSLITQAQIEPLLDHEWQLEKIVIDNEETLAEPDYNSPVGAWVKIDFHIPFFVFAGYIAGLNYDDENSSFTIYGMATNFGDYHDAASSALFEVPFISVGDLFEDWNNPFSYSFRNESEILYLDITNVNGDVATFFTTTLSNTAFERIELSIYPNPTSNLLHIEANQTDISRIEIFDIQGKQVMQVSATNLSEIDVSQLTNGMYFLKVRTSEGELTKKFVKK